MPTPGQKFYQKLLDGKIHECAYEKPYEGTSLWVAKVLDNYENSISYPRGTTFLCETRY